MAGVSIPARQARPWTTPNFCAFFVETSPIAPLARENHVKQDDIRPQRPPSARPKSVDRHIFRFAARRRSRFAAGGPACAGSDRSHFFDKNGFGRPPHSTPSPSATVPPCGVTP